MKNKVIVAVFLLGVVAFAALGAAGEIGFLPDAWTEWAPLALVVGGVLLLVLAWRCWGSLMAWVFGKDRENVK